MIEIKGVLYNKDKIVSIKKYDDTSEFLTCVKSYNLRVSMSEGKDVYIEFEKEEDRDAEFNRIAKGEN